MEQQNTVHHRTAKIKEQQNTEHWWNSRTPRKSGGTTEYPGTPAEHPRIQTEHHRSTSGTTRNNGTIQNEE